MADKELIEYLDEKFGRVDGQFIDVEGRFGTLERILENKADKADVNNLTNAIDKLVKSVEDLKTEYSAITVAINRHEKWFKELAEKVGIKLEY